MSESSKKSLLDYLKAITGDLPWIEPVSARIASALPLFLKQRYRLCRIHLFGRKYFLATEESQIAAPSPKEYARHASLLKEQLSGDVILVLSNIPAYVRNRLISQRVPFIVPGTQTFLPMLMIDLREYFPAPRTSIQNTLSSVSQLLIIYHLSRESLSGIPLAQIASRIGYSAMAISKAQEELQSTHLVKVVRSGKALSLHFNSSGNDLWQRVEPLLSSPVKQAQWIRWGRPKPRAVLAGITALSRYSMLEGDPVPTYAMRERNLMAALREGHVCACSGSEDAEARMEAWKYDPLVLANGDTADRYSLYLSLRLSGDERVQKELRHLTEGDPR